MYAYDAENRVTSVSMPSQPPFESYVYTATGMRDRKIGADGSKTWYWYWNNQVQSEIHPTGPGTWGTSFVYANGQKVAAIGGLDHRLHL